MVRVGDFSTEAFVSAAGAEGGAGVILALLSSDRGAVGIGDTAAAAGAVGAEAGGFALEARGAVNIVGAGCVVITGDCVCDTAAAAGALGMFDGGGAWLAVDPKAGTWGACGGGEVERCGPLLA